MCVGAHGTACVCRSEDKVQGSVLTFQHVSPGDGIWVIGINISHCYLLSNLSGPEPFLYMGLKHSRFWYLPRVLRWTLPG